MKMLKWCAVLFVAALLGRLIMDAQRRSDHGSDHVSWLRDHGCL
jgi:hypothetical protein